MEPSPTIAWPFTRADEILRACREITTAAPRELAVWLELLHAPAAPFVPQEWHGQRLCAMAVCYSGDLAETAQALAPIRALGAPVVDLLHEQPYTQVQYYLDATEPKGMHYYWKTDYLAELTDDFLSELAGSSPNAPSLRRTSASSTSAVRARRTNPTGRARRSSRPVNGGSRVSKVLFVCVGNQGRSVMAERCSGAPRPAGTKRSRPARTPAPASTRTWSKLSPRSA
jgi:hypothetical protein